MVCGCKCAANQVLLESLRGSPRLGSATSHCRLGNCVGADSGGNFNTIELPALNRVLRLAACVRHTARANARADASADVWSRAIRAQNIGMLQAPLPAARPAESATGLLQHRVRWGRFEVGLTADELLSGDAAEALASGCEREVKSENRSLASIELRGGRRPLR
jgi:hypothetical protein